MNVRQGTRLSIAGVVAAAAILLGGVAPAYAAPAATAGGGTATGASSAPATVSGGTANGTDAARQAADYWTPERMRSARPAETLAKGTRPSSEPAGTPTGSAASVPPAAPTAPVGTAKAGGTRSGLAVNASATVGKVFFHNPTDGYDYVCSAATVNSGSRLLAMTAGHCVHGGRGGQWMQNWIFVPLYNYGYEPYGRWSAKYLTTFNAWINDSNLDRDVGWVTLWPNGSGQRPVDVVGGNGLSVNYSYDQAITILAYPAEAPYDGGWQQYCQGTTDRPGIWPFQENKIELHCGFTGGSSGSPWLRLYDGSLGYVNGVMSTLNSSGWNKSSYFDTAVMDVFNSVANRT
ncbi:hypothetical protein ACFFWC_20385 [Plantactinospora siamensis]|uniref:V8-like Glu-specific endopeptidase n=1 Tax=Plantactinospora siamensis TaxID=555372 RepID=A0ABV6P2Y7_9ACTN